MPYQVEKFKINKACEKLFALARSTVIRYGMEEMLGKGVLVGLSGGADSVLLLLFLLYYRENYNTSMNVVACHVNHLIRGDEAFRDLEFTRNFCSKYGVELCEVEVDVPSLAKQEALGLEEAARNARYSAFNKIILSRNDIDTIALAHNASDNLETVIFNMMRGSGLSGMCGIPPIRDNIVRPFIQIPKSEIVDSLNKGGISYVTDSTNLSTDYTRNYIRHEIDRKSVV